MFPTRDQSSLTIAHLLVEHTILRHGVAVELLSDSGTSFLSKLMFEIYKLLGTKKTSTTAYHPQTDGLVEQFSHPLTDMLSKEVHHSGKDWDIQLPYVLFAYHSSPQESTKESPFFSPLSKPHSNVKSSMVAQAQRAMVKTGLQH